ncbi:MAG: hypothetical protein E6J72_02625 [Deltaproteobacteria bacterium]|nr:MAG: hypothetical protein E6J72_02625 [Deltaproteobacteria bacterium]
MTARATSGRSAHRADDGGTALVTALLAMVLAGGAAVLFAELARTTLVRARVDRDGVAAWYLAEAGLAETVAALPAGGTFSADLAAHAGTPPAPIAGGYAATLADDHDDTPDDPLVDRNQRMLVRIVAAGPPPVERRLEAVVGREPAPFFPGAATLAGGVSNLTGDFRLDGHDGAMDTGCMMPGSGRTRAGMSLPDGAALPVLEHPEQVSGIGGTPSVTRERPPDLTALASSAGAVRPAPTAMPVTLGTTAAPQVTVVDGDAAIDGTTSGAGILYVSGHVRVTGTLDFAGVVAAAGGVEIATTGQLRICGALWAAGTTALDARGAGAVRASTDAIAMAARLAPLPARAQVLAVRELF